MLEGRVWRYSSKSSIHKPNWERKIQPEDGLYSASGRFVCDCATRNGISELNRNAVLQSVQRWQLPEEKAGIRGRMNLKNRKIENTPEIRNLRTSLELWEQGERRKKSKIRNTLQARNWRGVLEGFVFQNDACIIFLVWKYHLFAEDQKKVLFPHGNQHISSFLECRRTEFFSGLR